MGSRPDGWWRDRAGAAARLVARLPAAVGADLEGPVREVVAVLEGAARQGVPEGPVAGGPVRVVHAPGPGDDLLTALCRPGVLLVTADRELARRARERGARVVGPGRLLALLEPR